MIAYAQQGKWEQRWARDPDPQTVVLAEADDDLREQLADELRNDGYQVIELADGFELEDYLSSALAPDGHCMPPDIIVSDAQMPGTSGLEVLAHLRADRSMTPFIVINSAGDLSTYEKAESLGADFVLETPLDIDELCSVVHIAV